MGTEPQRTWRQGQGRGGRERTVREELVGRVLRAGPAGKGTKTQLPPTFWWWPVALGAHWPRVALLRSVPQLTWPPPVCVPVSSLLRRSPPVSGLWSTPIQYNLILFHLQRPCLQVSSGSEAPRGHAFWGHHSPSTPCSLFPCRY